MDALNIVALAIVAVVSAAAVVMVVRTAMRMVAVIRLGASDKTRTDRAGRRVKTMLKETLGHTRMLQWGVVGAAHWFVFIAFGALLPTLVEAYIQVINPEWAIPWFSHWPVWTLGSELIALTMLIGILTLIVIRRLNLPSRRPKARFEGSRMWQAYYVEITIVAIGVCEFALRSLVIAEGADIPAWASPIGYVLSRLYTAGDGVPAAIVVVAAIKILVSMAWFMVIARNITMGVAWHRFTAFFNIYFKRDPERVALGALKPMTVDGEKLDFETADPEKDPFGVGQVEQFTWKGLLDFTTCTECGRCQSQCPAWNTDKPLSPKLLVMSLREHAYAKAPYLMAGGRKDALGEETATEEQLAGVNVLALAEAERPLVGPVADGGVIDPDVLWSCTTCGACVEQCPVDIEHVDHIIDMRRHQVMIESAFPAEAGTMLRNLENKGNPWGANPNTRDDWTKGLDFEVPRVEDPSTEWDYLFWVGCAGAFDDRAKKTTRAVATLLHEAGVKFAILGKAEGCTGDPARRIGNEFLFTMLAEANVETLNDIGLNKTDPSVSTKIVATCPHCLNSLGNEYGQLGGHYDVVHHTQLLATLVADGKLTPVSKVDGGVTYHDPCYLGRHNRIFTPPREVLGAVAEEGLTEMPRNAERSFCCGAGGARMWMEETIGTRININRTEEALDTGARTIAVGCPFCATMLGDGVNAKEASERVEVVDVAQVLLRTVKGVDK
ncbi:(Fe-S)-binding protein [Phytomonospora endophytica]|uniref:Fe-S oxidoreductase n=1 Tax=Phytomonospora endophytica TaxID=714109 RepID=A0A841G2W8_9ACTN|nr:(Fe-S)-binding protein [Phytomonospora endophytica]MBB6039977.1 Fe-S oxidoreductase [Phytomonospora endophytica]GIG69817.1 Fe-S oxidoreductase [Phytomonospora endophytica]